MRLMLVLAPVMCILSGIAVSSTLTTYMKNLDVAHKDKKVKRTDMNYPFKNEVPNAQWLSQVPRENQNFNLYSVFCNICVCFCLEL